VERKNSLVAVTTWVKLLTQAVVAGALISCVSHEQEDGPRELSWEDLVPKSQTFSPEKAQFESLHSSSFVPEQYIGSVVPELDGQRVKISAFIVPLDGDNGSLSELMLVPYFGACIHVPPPPTNQIIYFESDTNVVNVDGLDLRMPVVATGTLFTEKTAHAVAQVGYRMSIESVKKHKLNY